MLQANKGGYEGPDLQFYVRSGPLDPHWVSNLGPLTPKASYARVLIIFKVEGFSLVDNLFLGRKETEGCLIVLFLNKSWILSQSVFHIDITRKCISFYFKKSQTGTSMNFVFCHCETKNYKRNISTPENSMYGKYWTETLSPVFCLF